MNITRFILLLAMLVAGNMAYPAEKLRILDRGLDGNQRIYLITCPHGKNASVVQTFSAPVQIVEDRDHKLRITRGSSPAPVLVRVCIYPTDSPEQCRPIWALEEAAGASCSG